MNPKTSRRLLPVVVGVVGLIAAVAIASFGRMGISSTAGLLAWTLGGAAASTGLAVLLLWLLRRRPVTVQVTVASLAPVVAVAAGVVGGSWTMFISGHDLRTLVVILVGAGTVGVITALVFGARISKASAGLGEIARRIGDQSVDPRSHAASRFAGDGGPGELAGLARDLDAALARLEESRAEAAALEQSRRELVAWVSHDLRTPLAGIRAMVEALEDGVVEDRETVDRYHRTIRVEVERLTSLVADLFELSRIHAGALHLELTPQRLDEVLSDVVAGATLLARVKGVLLAVSSEGSPMVRVSQSEMGRAVQNLVDNAIRHTPPGGRIQVEVSTDEEASRATVSVSDGCGGIPDKDLARVFDLAFRGDDARSPDGRAGLGLAVTRGLVEAQKGQVGVSNTSDGCRFTISLPLAEPRRSAVGTQLEQVL